MTSVVIPKLHYKNAQETSYQQEITDIPSSVESKNAKITPNILQLHPPLKTNVNSNLERIKTSQNVKNENTESNAAGSDEKADIRSCLDKLISELSNDKPNESCDEQKVQSEKGKLSFDNQKISGDEKKTISDDNEVLTDDEALTDDDETITEDSEIEINANPHPVLDFTLACRTSSGSVPEENQPKNCDVSANSVPNLTSHNLNIKQKTDTAATDDVDSKLQSKELISETITQKQDVERTNDEISRDHEMIKEESEDTLSQSTEAEVKNCPDDDTNPDSENKTQRKRRSEGEPDKLSDQDSGVSKTTTATKVRC